MIMPPPRTLISRAKSKAERTARNLLSRREPAASSLTGPVERHYKMALMGSFAAKPGNGLVISVLRRAQVLRDRGNLVDVIAFPFDTRFRHAARSVNKKYGLGKSITFRNPYAEIRGDNYRDAIEPVDALPAGGEFRIVPDPANPKMRRAYRGDRYEQFIYSDAKTRVVFIDHLAPDGKRTRRAWHDAAGRTTKIEYFAGGEKPVRVEYIHVDGSVCLNANVDAHGTEKDFGLSLPDGRNETFATVSKLESWWLVNFVLAEKSWNPIISEYGFRANVFEDAALERDLSVAYALHNLHLTAPYSYGSPLKGELEPFFKGLAGYDAVVALTQEQRLDLIRSMDSADNVFVIPHHFEGENFPAPKAPRSVVMSARVVRTKGHFDAVKVWPRILEQFPDAVLNIYGTGPDLEELRAAVKAAALESSILLHGFEQDVVKRVSEAEIAILPSQFEGFPLSLIETMSVGTVPVAYDFKYGARAMIEHGVNGFITERSNLDELADSVIYLMRNPAVLRQMSDSARLVTQKFSAERLGREWVELFDELERRSTT